jgi:hypothetical protein
MRKFAGLLGTVGLCLVSGIIGGALTRQFGTSSYTLSYADFVSIMLTGISLLMALLGFFIAILAFIGWNGISGKVASDVSKFLADGFKDGEPLHRMLVDQTNRAMYDGVYVVDDDLSFDDGTGTPEKPEKV